MRGAVALAVAVALVAGLLALTDRATLSSLVAAMDPTWLLLAFLAFAVGTAVRARRFQVLSHATAGTGVVPYLRVTAIHQLLLMVLPLRMGELSYPVLMRAHLGRALPQGVGDLLLARLFDLVLASLCFALGLLALGGVSGGDEMLIAAVVLVVVGTVAVLQLPAGVHLGRGWLIRLRAPAPLRRFARSLDHSVHRAGRAMLAPAAFLSVAATIVGVVRIDWLFDAFGVETGVLGATLLFGAGNLLGLVPLHGFGGLGPKQAGMAGVLVLLGIATAEAASVTLLFQAAVILFVVVLAVAAWSSWLVEGRALPSAREQE